jgi:choline dehydrogenase/5-(hydroxymethyl)furfural/furfural oxidase
MVDHLVVGAGASGAALAALLSDDPARTVLLLEAGPDRDPPPPGLRDPNFFAALEVPGALWQELTATRGGPGRPYVRGRGTGGGSAVNAMIAARGLPDDYDTWERDAGATGWSWASMHAALERAERRLQVRCSDPPWGAVDLALIESAQLAGHPWRADSRHGLGVGPLGLAFDGRQRVSVADAYLTPARSRTNLTVRGEATVEAVLFEGRRAVGVRLAGGEEIEAREVLLCAGALGSPSLLWRAGLDRPGIGANLQDHAAVRLVLGIEPTARARDDHQLAVATGLRWSSGLGGEGDLEVLPMNLVGTGAGAPAAGLLMVALLDVRTTGRVLVPEEGAPSVDIDLVGDDVDLTRLRLALRHAVELAGRAPFRRVVDTLVLEDGTDPADLDDDELDQWLPAHLDDYVHAAGTCRMGRPEDPRAVVDAHCRVIGVDGVRVVDASIMPKLPRAGPFLTCVAVAERAAELILAEAK